MTRLDFLDDALESLERADLLRTPRSHAELPAGALWLCSNDYLGLAERQSETRGSSGAGASALVWGYGPEHERAEEALARYAGVESCLLFSSGYAANVGVVSALAGPGDLVVSDALNHASLIDGCRLSGARVVVTPHLDLDAVSEALAGPGRRRFFVTESYFSMDGDGPDLRGVAAACEAAGAALVVDEAHAFGVLGPRGRGRCAEVGVVPDVLIGTLGKAFGLAGAFVGGTVSLRTWLWNRARSFVFSTAIPPSLAEVAARRVHDVEAAEGARIRVLELAETLRARLGELTGERPRGFGPIIPVAVGDAGATLVVARRLLAEGYVVQPMRPPTVPVGASRLRLTVRATIDAASVLRAADAIGWALEEVGATRRADSSRVSSTRAGRGRALTVAVVGTGTEVGKTHVASALVKHLARRGLRVAGRKPIESGVVGEMGDDQSKLEAAGSVGAPGPAPYRFARPVSPHLAAREAAVEIDIEEAVRWSRSPGPDGAAEVLVVETAGGLLSPLGPQLTNLDSVARLQPDVVVVVGADRLGVLHDVAACRVVLQARGLWDRCVVVLSAPSVADASTGTNSRELALVGVAPSALSWKRSADGAADLSAVEATWVAVTGVATRST